MLNSNRLFCFVFGVNSNGLLTTRLVDLAEPLALRLLPGFVMTLGHGLHLSNSSGEIFCKSTGFLDPLCLLNSRPIGRRGIGGERPMRRRRVARAASRCSIRILWLARFSCFLSVVDVKIGEASRANWPRRIPGYAVQEVGSVAMRVDHEENNE